MKKCLFPVFVALVLMGCADTTSSSSDDNACGNGVVDAGEKCDIKVAVTCQQFDATKTWQDGGAATCSADCTQIAQGTCAERQLTQGKCGDGVLNTGEKCDGNDGVSCAAFDATKQWQAGGKAACSSDCQKLEKGTCVEAANPQPGEKCGNAALDDGEKCDTKLTYTCADYDAAQNWDEGGVPVCDSCNSLLLGTCKLKGTQSCEEQGKDLCKGQCHDKCGEDETRDDDCVCQKKGDSQTCEDQGKETCKEKCYDKCGEDETRDNDCVCQKKATAETCAADGKDFCKDLCYDKCGEDETRDNDCVCQKKATAETCAADGKDFCKDLCHDKCGEGENRDENCVCQKSGEQEGCTGNADCKDESKPVCTKGTCVANKCGDGFVFGDEVCEDNVAATYSSKTCSDYNSTKSWMANGAPGCANCKLTEGTCVEDTADHCKDEKPACKPKLEFKKTCTELLGNSPTGYYKDETAAQCTEKCTIDSSGCIPDYCGNNNVEKDQGEICDFGRDTKDVVITEKKCADLDNKKWASGNATCKKSCTQLDTSKCVELTDQKQGFYWCQLMPPVTVVFDENKKEETMIVQYGIGSDVTETGMSAELVYGADPKKLDDWKNVTAKQDAANDKFTATLKSEHVAALNNKAYYTFRIKSSSSAKWQYCKLNSKAPESIDSTLSPAPSINGDAGLNINTAGLATVQTVDTGNILAKFDFDDTTKYKGTDPTNGGKGFEADVGTGNIRVATTSNWKCSDTCFAGGETGNGFSIGNCKKAKEGQDGAIASDGSVVGNHILISGINATNATNIDLAMSIKRNKKDSSPTNVVVRVSSDNWEWSEDIKLDDKDTNFHAITPINLPDSVHNKASFDIQIIPYGSGNALLKFDNVIVSKNNN